MKLFISIIAYMLIVCPFASADPAPGDRICAHYKGHTEELFCDTFPNLRYVKGGNSYFFEDGSSLVISDDTGLLAPRIPQPAFTWVSNAPGYSQKEKNSIFYMSDKYGEFSCLPRRSGKYLLGIASSDPVNCRLIEKSLDGWICQRSSCRSGRFHFDRVKIPYSHSFSAVNDRDKYMHACGSFRIRYSYLTWAFDCSDVTIESMLPIAAAESMNGGASSAHGGIYASRAAKLPDGIMAYGPYIKNCQ